MSLWQIVQAVVLLVAAPFAALHWATTPEREKRR